MNAVLLLTSLLDFGLGVYLFAKAFVMDCKGDLQTCGKIATSKTPVADTLKQLNEFIRAHSNVKQLRNYLLPQSKTSSNK